MAAVRVAREKRVLWVAAEAAPWVRVGGLSDIVGTMPGLLRTAGVDARVFLPFYQRLKNIPTQVLAEFAVAGYRVFVREAPPLKAIFLQCDEFFDRPEIYGAPDDGERFSVFAAAALEWAKRDGYDWIHAHDWQAAPALFGDVKGVFTIHNLAYQGPDGVLARALALARVVTTVSPSYALEIQTPASGCGLDALLRAKKPRGILNGIDSEEWDPERDKALVKKYSADDLSGKQSCKREMGFADPSLPLLVFVGRLAEQKGVDQLIDALWWHVPRDGLNAIVLGQGDPRLHGRLAEISRALGRAVHFIDAFDPALSHRVMAAGDFLAMPSLFEPCGLTQMQAQRYGTIPLARRTGGLVDTTEDGVTGFLYDPPTAPGLQSAIWRALVLYREQPAAFREMQVAGMKKDFSFAARVPEYVALYT